MQKSPVWRAAALAFLCTCAGLAQAQLRIEITDYAGKQTPVAIVPFAWEGEDADAPYDISGVIAADLRRSGRFEPISCRKHAADADFWRRHRF